MRVCSGRFAPVPPGRYSPELVAFCHNLLSLDPRKRCAFMFCVHSRVRVYLRMWGVSSDLGGCHHAGHHAEQCLCS